MKNEKLKKILPFFLIVAFFTVGWSFHRNYWPVYEKKPVSLFWTRDLPDSCSGNPENAVTRFEKIYKYLDAYRKKNNELPPPGVLMRGELDGKQLLSESEDFYLPDQNCSEQTKDRKSSPFEFSYWANRPDGTRKPASPQKGQRDIWMVCREYSKMNRSSRVGIANSRLFHRVKYEPSGFDIVLWSDGAVEKISPEKRISFYANGEYIESYFGQVGLQGKEIATFAQMISQKSIKK